MDNAPASGFPPVEPARAEGAAPRTLPRPPIAELAPGVTMPRRISPTILSGLVRLSEFLIVTLSGAMITLAYVPAQDRAADAYLMALPGLGLLTVVVYRMFDLYHIGALRTFIAQGLKLLGGWALVFLVALAMVFFTKMQESFSRVVFGSWFLVGLMLILAQRSAVALLIRSLSERGLLDRRVALVGGGDAATHFLTALDQEKSTDLRICGVFDDRTDTRSPDMVAGYPKLGTVDDLVDYARHAKLDLIIFTLPVSAEGRILAMLRKLWVLPIDIRLAAHTQKLRFRPRNYSFIGSLPMFDMADRPVADWDLVAKVLFDKIIGGLLLLLLSPVLLAVAIAVRLDSPGPALFRQKRYGFNNELIEVFKFRSMYTDQCDPTARQLVTKGDPRVTRVGRFIRKTSLDELAQLINVVFYGNLSLVGPRPHALHAKAENKLYNDVVDGYFARHKVKPGITGWAQANGWRGETDTQEKIQKRVEHDLYYIENWSLAFDLYILIITPFALVRSENAY